jgi:poly(hydroxyalkanoate) depolymerase family esterase
MPRRRPTRALPSGLRSLLPRMPRRVKRPTLPALPKALTPTRVRPRARPDTARRTPRPAAEGVWIGGAYLGAAGGRSYDVYVPAGLRRRTAAPLVMLLHGCGQTPAEFAEATRFTDAADRNGFLLVLPHQQTRHHPQRCWRWYEAAHQQRDAGEPGVLAGIVAQVGTEETRWRVDSRRVYVAGLSAGGAMALTLAATYPDVFAAAGVHSAPAYRSSTGPAQALAAMAARTAVPPPGPGDAAIAPTIIVQGSVDSVVRPLNGDRVADQWLAHESATESDDPVGRSRSESGRTADGRRHDVLRWYTARGRKVLEYWVVEGLGHAWSGGRENGSFSDPHGPRATTLMWSFFRLHALDRRAGRPVSAVGA